MIRLWKRNDAANFFLNEMIDRLVVLFRERDAQLYRRQKTVRAGRVPVRSRAAGTAAVTANAQRKSAEAGAVSGSRPRRALKGGAR